MRKPLSKYSFLPRTVTEMTQFISTLQESLLKMEESFSKVDFESVPKKIKLPTFDTFKDINLNLTQILDAYSSSAVIHKKSRTSVLSRFVFISPSLNTVLENCPVTLLKKNNMYWMRHTDWMTVWSTWFRSKGLFEKKCVNLPPCLEEILNIKNPSWKEFQKHVYNLVSYDTNISDEDMNKWKKWKEYLTNEKNEASRKPKKVRVKKEKVVKRMVPRKS